MTGGRARAALVAALKDATNRPPQFVKRWQDLTPPSRAINHLPTNVRIDNATAERYTILTIFAYDRMGLLYTITRSLFELELSVCRAKIGTRLDQAIVNRHRGFRRQLLGDDRTHQQSEAIHLMRTLQAARSKPLHEAAQPRVMAHQMPPGLRVVHLHDVDYRRPQIRMSAL